mmetsp:Transcript_49446/g.96701  ORF Transcript_49446/g.96701 Transcript_49446/m.96701 type:complete len:319 (+) Transcript_49446:7968-8924(+)
MEGDLVAPVVAVAKAFIAQDAGGILLAGAAVPRNVAGAEDVATGTGRRMFDGGVHVARREGGERPQPPPQVGLAESMPRRGGGGKTPRVQIRIGHHHRVRPRPHVLVLRPRQGVKGRRRQRREGRTEGHRRRGVVCQGQAGIIGGRRVHAQRRAGSLAPATGHGEAREAQASRGTDIPRWPQRSGRSRPRTVRVCPRKNDGVEGGVGLQCAQRRRAGVDCVEQDAPLVRGRRGAGTATSRATTERTAVTTPWSDLTGGAGAGTGEVIVSETPGMSAEGSLQDGSVLGGLRHSAGDEEQVGGKGVRPAREGRVAGWDYA